MGVGASATKGGGSTGQAEGAVSEGNVEVDGVRLWFDIAGEGRPTLLIGGTGMSGSVWEFLGASVLRDCGCQVITFDNRGVGRSDGPPGPYSIEGMAAETAGLITALGVGPVNVLGLSLGGAIAQQLAATRPDLVQAAVLWAATEIGRATSELQS